MLIDSRIKRNTAYLLVFVLFLLLFTGCSKNRESSGREIVSVWYHTGRPAEQRVFEAQVKRFNAGQDKIRIELTMIPEGDYNTQVQAAAVNDNLPDLLDMDGPYLYNYAWKGHLLPLDDLLPDNLKNDLIPTVIKQGTYENKLYSVAVFDSGLGLYANRPMLEKIGVRIPDHPDNAWCARKFNEILALLAENDPDGQVLDLRMDYSGEWYTYAFSPILQSAGGDLIDRRDYLGADGFLNSEATVEVMQRIAGWFAKNYIDPNTDAQSFTNERVAFSLCGHWEYPRYKGALGDKLIILPLPDFGHGSKTAMGSWSWAIPRSSEHPEAAMEFLKFLLQKEEILRMCAANAAIPATGSALTDSRLYREDGPLHLFAEQLDFAIPRPRTPAYPVITSAFQQAFMDIRHGADVKMTLDRAVKVIDQDIEDNRGYK